MLNNQKPEPRSKGDGGVLDVHSVFYTIQGEGPFAGRTAVFIRLAGCNLQCPGCDTEYTQGRALLTPDEIEKRVHREWAAKTSVKPLIVITGGEPLRQSTGWLCDLLSTCGYDIQIESNGVFAPDSTLDYLLCAGKVVLIVSPKTTRVHPRSATLATAFKYVLDAGSIDARDGLPIKALDHPASTGVARPPEGFRGEVYLNPFDAKNETDNALNLSAVVQSCLKFGHRCGIQLHKLINVD
jgi:organic radical activating enzyme